MSMPEVDSMVLEQPAVIKAFMQTLKEALGAGYHGALKDAKMQT